jgi:hypothetical protein
MVFVMEKNQHICNANENTIHANAWTIEKLIDPYEKVHHIFFPAGWQLPRKGAE